MTLYKTITDKQTGDSSISMMFETVDDGDTATVDSSHPYFEKIQKILKKESKGKLSVEDAEKKIIKLVNPFINLVEDINSLSSNLTYSENKIFYKHEPLDAEMSKIMLDIVKTAASEDASTRNKYQAKVAALTNFIEKLYSGASETARRNLFRWIQDRDLVIYPDGDFLAYKGVVRLEDGTYVSGFSGTAFVNNVLFENQRIPNAVGDVVSMPPSAVEDNEDRACGTGLHAGTHSYASGYHQGGFLRVKINPADVISVPKDSEGQKIRTSRYVVMDANDEEIRTAGVTFDYEGYSDDEDDEDGWDDEDDDYGWGYEDYEEEDDEDEEEDSSSYSLSEGTVVGLAKNADSNGSYLEFDYKGNRRKVIIDSVVGTPGNARVSGTVANEGNAYKSFLVSFMSNVSIGERVLDQNKSDSEPVQEKPMEPVTESFWDRFKSDAGFAQSAKNHPSQGAPAADEKPKEEPVEKIEEQVEEIKEEVNNLQSGVEDLSNRFKEGFDDLNSTFHKRFEKIQKNVDRTQKLAEVFYPDETEKVKGFISEKRGYVTSFKDALVGKKSQGTDGGDASEK